MSDKSDSNKTNLNTSNNNNNNQDANMSSLWEYLKGKLSQLVQHAMHYGPSDSKGSGLPIVFLGETYDNLQDERFLEDFGSRLWMTYRSGFPLIAPSQYTCDAGWGCMLRSGQMILANTFITQELGRNWRLSHLGDKQILLKYTSIVSRFLDANTSTYSIHRIAVVGTQFDKQIGEWFGPSTVSQVLRVLVNNDRRTNLRVHVAGDGVVYKADVKKLVSTPPNPSSTGKASLLLLIPLRLGVDKMNPIYHPLIKECFNIKQCTGIAGGRPNSSLFFLGIDNNHLIYLDPHYSRQCLEVRDVSSFSAQALSSYHCESVRLLSITSLDPSLVIGFYCNDLADFESLCVTATSKLCQGDAPLFSIEEDAPTFHEEIDLISDDE